MDSLKPALRSRAKPSPAARACLVVSLAALPSCAGVPQLYRPARVNPDTALAPKVEHIVDRITCELAGVSRTHLAAGDYVITVLLTLQVNDEINLTPSLAFVEPLAAAGTNRTITEGLGIGGARERTFTSTFYFDSRQLATRPPCEESPRRLYRLDGDLGLAAIARDGIGIGSYQSAAGLSPAPSPPSFASQIKFTVTRSVGALGPTWTLVSFKGPGGANGLLNGKALTTDILNVAFAAKKKAEPAPAAERLVAALEELVRQRAAREREAAETAAAKRAELATAVRNERIRSSRFQSMLDKRRGQEAIRRVEAEVAAGEREQARAAAERARADADLEAARQAAQASASAQSQADAIATGQGLINTTILQNLNVQPR